MQDTKAGIRYAKSLFKLAIERKELEVVSADMTLINKTIHENPELRSMLKSPIIKSDKKASIIHAIFASNIGTTTAAFLDLIIKKRREMHVEQIARQFVILYLENNGVEEAVVTTAFAIDDTFRQRIIALVVKHCKNDKVVLEERIDPSIIGGFVLRFGDNQIDTSVEREIELLRREFEKNLYVKDY
jgi:F-type H+-transporting ATPase subunit delta